MELASWESWDQVSVVGFQGDRTTDVGIAARCRWRRRIAAHRARTAVNAKVNGTNCITSAYGSRVAPLTRTIWGITCYCYEYCLVQADVVGEGGCGGVGRVSSSSLWSCSCSWPRSCSGARGIAATNAYGSEIACFAYVSNGVVERSGSTVAFVFVLYAPSVPFTCALRIAAAVARAMPCRDRGERESVDVGRQVVPEYHRLLSGLQALTPVR